ncbi:hypothetical protein Hanom_Chr01g00023571 [Helianthus anomalus]
MLVFVSLCYFHPATTSNSPFEDSLMQEIVPELKTFRYEDLPFINLPIQDAIESTNMITPFRLHLEHS